MITHHSLAGLANSLIFSIDLPGTERADAATKHKLVVLAAKACCTLPYDRLCPSSHVEFAALITRAS